MFYAPKQNITSGKVILYVSKKNTRVNQVIDNLKVILQKENAPQGVKSVSDILCNWIMEKYDKLIEDVGLPQPPQDNKSRSTSAVVANHKEIKHDSFLKRLLCKKTIPALDKYHVYKIEGKSVSEAFDRGLLSTEDITNIYLGTAQIYYDMTRDRKLSNILHLVNSKNDTKRKNRLGWFGNKMKNVFESSKPTTADIPKDIHEYDLVE